MAQRSRVDASGALKMLAAYEKQLHYAMVVALTKTAQIAKEDARAAMGSEFDRPTSYTLNSLYVKPATKADPVAVVGIREWGGKGTPATKYLTPQVYGGNRRPKRFEVALQQAGIMPAGMFAMPGEEAQMDSFGNMKRGQIVKILSHLRASRDTTQNRSTSGRNRGRRRMETYFAVPVGSDNPLPPGVYWRDKADPRPVLIFTKSPHYAPRYNLYDIVKESAKRNLLPEFRKALRKAVATMRW
ncbi:hypothetical protein [Azospirillum lipoferum]|uniref:Uncharacterized protein n=1 Tax=Azospirillum lipoferum (strain 4B) TaxID=862719 RepID=G7ZE07_AZOL4|nr:hypothetical protein [Azospirillum lipoferum]CBS89229.1 Conserved protein of unknown function [Azospirillum lipoferum 4B]